MASQPNGKANAHATQALKAEVGQLVLVLQGGGALGSYQAGVYHAIHDADLEPDWIIGTSIGAINAGLIAGNEPANRLAALEEFWKCVAYRPVEWSLLAHPLFSQHLSLWSILYGGLPSFFKPNPLAFLGTGVPLGADSAAYYSTEPLKRTLDELVDVSVLNRGAPRLTVGAARVCTSRMRYFDSRSETLDIRHIMASGALPPAFPAVRIDGDLYWDGGILSNTPTEIVFDDNPRRNSLIFAVHLWNPTGPEPKTISDVMQRCKDIRFSSRVESHIARQKETHRLRHIIKELAACISDADRQSARVRELESWGCVTRMHVVRLLAPSLTDEERTKDVDFSHTGIRARWQAGYDHARQAIERAPWRGEFDPLEGVILHEPPRAGGLDRPTVPDGGAEPASTGVPRPARSAHAARERV